MSKMISTLAMRAMVLAGLLVLNSAMPAEAAPDCQQCMSIGGQIGCLHYQPSGHEECMPHPGENHCDVFYPC